MHAIPLIVINYAHGGAADFCDPILHLANEFICTGNHIQLWARQGTHSRWSAEEVMARKGEWRARGHGWGEAIGIGGWRGGEGFEDMCRGGRVGEGEGDSRR